MKRWIVALAMCVPSVVCAWLMYHTNPPTPVIVLLCGMMYVPPVILIAKVADYVLSTRRETRWSWERRD